MTNPCGGWSYRKRNELVSKLVNVLINKVRLLRVIQSGEFIKVGSSTVQKTDVRVIAATNVNLPKAIASGKFREDLYYRLNTVPITIPPLRARKDDIHLLFKKFAADFADRYVMPPVRLEPEAVQMLEAYAWPGNIRQHYPDTAGRAEILPVG